VSFEDEEALPLHGRRDGPTQNRPTPSDSKVPKPRKVRKGKKITSGQTPSQPSQPSDSTSNPPNSGSASSGPKAGKAAQPVLEKGKGGSPSKAKRRPNQSKSGPNQKSSSPDPTDDKGSGSTDEKVQQPKASGKRGAKNKKKGKGGEGNENDDLVSYLQQTGSILALAELLDQEEDMDSLNNNHV